MTERVKIRTDDRWRPTEVLSWSLEGDVWWANDQARGRGAWDVRRGGDVRDAGGR